MILPSRQSKPFRLRTFFYRMCFYGLFPMPFLATPSHAQDLVNLTVTGTPDDHVVAWQTQSFKNYQLETSPNLLDWGEIGVVEQGDGLPRSICCMTGSDRQYYRVRITNDPFILLPLEGAEINMADGVSFAFNLNLFPSLPVKLRIYQRAGNSNAAWTQIGRITDFISTLGQKAVRGSVVWLPSAVGLYEVKAEAVNAAGGILHSETRTVSVVAVTAPSVTISDGPPAVSTSSVEAVFTTTFTVPEEKIRRVDFYDNGVLLESDRIPPFGDNLKDRQGNRFKLLRGNHSITARAYDTRSKSSVSVPYTVQVTGGYARSEVVVSGGYTSSNPTLVPFPAVLNVLQGESFSIVCNVTDADGIGTIKSLTGYRKPEPDQLIEAIDIDETPPFGPITLDTDDWHLGPHTIALEAEDYAAPLPYFTYSDTNISYPRYFLINVINGTPNTLAQTLAGQIVDLTSVNLSNASFSGVGLSSQIFTGGLSSGLQIPGGIVMTTGKAASWNGGDGFAEGEGNNRENDSEKVTEIWSSPGDPALLDRISGKSTADAAALEFDVSCPNGQLELEYQFGSEEYDEYVGRFNDGFVVTVDDVAVSLLPDGVRLVAVNTVNLDTNRDFFLGDDEDIDSLMALNNPDNRNNVVEYDGMTIALKIHALVAPIQNHRVRIVIGDVSDAKYDSALFIRQGSLRTISPQP